jgi:DNA-binding MarR family transcriptional regulator
MICCGLQILRSAHYYQERKLVELILELKNRCRLDREIGEHMNLKDKEIAILSEISRNSKATSRTLSRKAGLSVSRSSRVIAALSARGLVSVSQNENDRRAINISLTQSGKLCVKKLEKEISRCSRELSESLSEEEKTTVLNGLNILLKKL